jgi:hypothetical protein
MCNFAVMDFTIYPYDRLPEFIRENETLRQTLLQSGGIVKFLAEHIDDPYDDAAPLLFVQYQNYVAENYRREIRWNPNRQNWSIEDLRQRALNVRNHLLEEYQCRRVLLRNLRMHMDVPLTARNMVDELELKYLEYAWKEDLRRQRPDIDTNLGTYKYVMQQFQYCLPMEDNGLACRSIDIALKMHHGYELTDTEMFESFIMELFHKYFFGPTIEERLKRGIKDLLHGKNAKACRGEAMSMLKSVQWFSRHIYNDAAEKVLTDSFTIEDKRWLRNLLEHYDRDRFSEEELIFFYFGMLLADVGRLWHRMLRRYADIDLSELEKEANSFVNTNSSVNQDTWEDEEDFFENETSFKMLTSHTEYDEQNEKLTIVEKEVDLSKTIEKVARSAFDKYMSELTASDEDIDEIFDEDDERITKAENAALSKTGNQSGISGLIHSIAASAQTANNIDEAWDDTYDFIFDKRVKPQEIKRAIEKVKSEKIKERRFYYVAYRILKVIKWIPVEVSDSDYLRWINCHFECGRETNENKKKAFLFNLEGSVKKLDDLHPSDWKDDSIYGKLGKHYRMLAISFKNTFTVTIINGKPVADSESYEHLKDRVEFLSETRDVHGLLWAPDEAYINDWK